LWITIDDNEGHYLKVLCDELFGRRNFITTVVWQKKYTQANDATFFSDNHDFILVYAKDRDRFVLNSLPRSAKQNDAYTNPDMDPRGPWKATPLHAKSGSDPNSSFRFRNGVIWKPPVGTYPRFSTKRLTEMDENNEIWFGKNGKSIPSRKTYLTDVKQGVAPTSIWLHEEVGHNHEARSEARELVPDDPFSTPKPERLLHRILTLATDPGDWVLDSFAGSGTTGAVAHKMGRKWIIVELGDHCHTHIVPRLQKVIDGKDLGGITESVDWNGGGGFRYYTLAPSLLERDSFGNLIISKTYNPAMLAEALCKLEGFTYAPSETEFWQHGHSTESDFLYVTTQTLTRDQLADLSERVGDRRTLLVLCTAFRAKGLDEFPNLTVKKIPKTIQHRCEWGQDDYSLEIRNLPAAASKEPDPAPQSDGNGSPRSRRQRTSDMPLFGGDDQ
jgi:adenine-specific DNA-methyltransferase